MSFLSMRPVYFCQKMTERIQIVSDATLIKIYINVCVGSNDINIKDMDTILIKHSI